MSSITIIAPDRLDYSGECLQNFDQDAIEESLDQITKVTKVLEDRLEQFYSEFRKRFDGYSPELLSGLIHLQKIKISNQL